MAILLIFLSLLFVAPVTAQEIKPLYQLPAKNTNSNSNEKVLDSDVFLVGSDTGLYKINSNGFVVPLWNEARVDQIIPVKAGDEKSTAWFIRSTRGIFYTEDLKIFTERDQGLPFLTIKKYNGKDITLEKQIQSLKDFCVNPLNNNEIVTATKDAVYFSSDKGQKWISVGSSSTTVGVKAVAVTTIEGETVIFMSHPIKGLAYMFPNRQNKTWRQVSGGLFIMPSLKDPDEISDILPVPVYDAEGNLTDTTDLYISQSYVPRIYKFDWTNKRAECIYQGSDPVNAIDGLTMIGNVLLYTQLEGFGAIDVNTKQSPGKPKMLAEWEKAFSNVSGMVNTAYIPKKKSGFDQSIVLNELWTLYPGTINTPYAQKALDKKSIYASAYQCRNQAGIDKYIKLVKDRNMNSIVIDMKDDYGYLRYNTKNPLLLEKGKMSSYKIDVEHFVSEFKKNNIYLVARIVTFKDKVLSQYAGGKYAVWDASTNKPWIGVKSYEKITNDKGEVTGSKANYYDEYWVDPYSEEVWEYTVTVAQDLIALGFDEIQFDYIRFPTDGKNLGNAKYRWRNQGMDKEAALISFLSYARANIDAPIGIDIYGANGWYRSGARTGQDSEMLAEYCDVIGPMFYPSHFEQSFLNYDPWPERSYRIYYYGTFRNTVLCRNRAIIRPWVQCFYLNVSYDRTYYNSDYIKKEFFGTRDSVNRGYMCWNNSGNYDVTPKDVGDKEAYTGKAPESKFSDRIPAIGTRKRTTSKSASTDLSILDSINNQNQKDEQKKEYVPFLLLPALNIK
ncbi:MAG: hypothetical protein IKX23_00405 [Treponema sp.]|nr:hypothetical protein [Treponema sp.]